MCMSIINAHDSVAYIILNIVQPNNDKINNLVLPYTETHERRFVFSCKPAYAVHALKPKYITIAQLLMSLSTIKER